MASVQVGQGPWEGSSELSKRLRKTEAAARPLTSQLSLGPSGETDEKCGTRAAPSKRNRGRVGKIRALRLGVRVPGAQAES